MKRQKLTRFMDGPSSTVARKRFLMLSLIYKVGNYRIEPPGLFRGRGEHPKTGTLKGRVLPEQVTLNIGENAKVPDPPAGHKWGKIQHDNSVTWLATWKDNVNGNIKYVFLAANSSLKGQSDFKKFEKVQPCIANTIRLVS